MDVKTSVMKEMKVVFALFIGFWVSVSHAAPQSCFDLFNGRANESTAMRNVTADVNPEWREPSSETEIANWAPIAYAKRNYILTDQPTGQVASLFEMGTAVKSGRGDFNLFFVIRLASTKEIIARTDRLLGWQKEVTFKYLNKEGEGFGGWHGADWRFTPEHLFGYLGVDPAILVQ